MTNVRYFIILLVLFPGSTAFAEPRTIHDFTAEGFETTYSAWSGKVNAEGFATVVNAPNNGGGLVNRNYDLSGWEKGTPALRLRILPGNSDDTQVTIISPADNSRFNSGHPLRIEAQASDSDGRVVRVEFYDGRHKIGEATEAPFEITWTCCDLGEHEVSALAVDNRGARTFSKDRPRVSVTTTSSRP